MSVLPVGFGSAVAGYQIQRSLRFNSADSAYLNRTPGSAPSNADIGTWSFWVKRTKLATEEYIFGARDGGNVTLTGIRFTSGDALEFTMFSGGTALARRITTQLFRDVGAWYHFVVVYDSTLATASDRVKIYVNGVQITAFSTTTNPSQNQDLIRWAANGIPNYIGNEGTTLGNYGDYYLTEVNYLDGQFPTTTTRTVNGVTQTILTQLGEFDSSTGVWTPKAWGGTYGTNGFYVNFSDNSNTTAATLGKDYSGNGNNWTPNNFSVTAGAGNDSLVDSPTSYGTDTGVGGEVRGNYATWNPLINGDSAANGNLDVTNDTARSTQVLLQFDTYWEITSTGGTTTAGTVSGTGTTNTTTIASTKTYGFRLTTAGTLDYKNITDGGSFTNITTGLTSQQFIYASAAAATTGSLNAGQRPFAATAPSGFKALCTQNLPTPTIGATSTTQADDYFNTVIWIGNGSQVTTGFDPQLLWYKARDVTGFGGVVDGIRGDDTYLQTYTTSAEATSSGLLVTNSTGFVPGSAFSTNSYVAWCWNSASSNTTNTSGTITSTVRANTTSGFSVVSYTGTGANDTVGHGCQVGGVATAPSMVIVKCRTQGIGYNWGVYHTSIGAGNVLLLSGTSGSIPSSAVWNNTAPTSSVFSVGTDNAINQNTQTYIAYCFAPLAGYSAFGTYTGNNSSTDGTFVYLGFRPRFLMIKSTSGSTSWVMMDSSRNTYNLADTSLYADSSNSETTIGTVNDIDFLSNGFKLRNNTGFVNASQTYIYAAFAESPFKYALAR